MANTILTPDIIAREALMVLRNNAVMARLVHRDYSAEFVSGVGDTITIRRPAKFTANEFGGSSINVQDVAEGGVPVHMDKHLDVSFAVTSKEMSMDIADFSAQLLVPAMQAFADKVDSYLLALQAEITNRVDGTSVVRDDIVDARRHLTRCAAPLADRRFVYGADMEAELLKDTAFITADKVGDNGTALRDASLGRKFGMDFYVDQNIGAVDTGSTVSVTALKVNGAANATDTIGLDATSVTGVLKKGTWLTIGGEHYRVMNDVTAASNAFAGVKLDRALTAADNTDVTVTAKYTPALAFHKNAFALVTRPLAQPMGAAKSAIVSYDGFGLRVVYDYDIQTKTDTVSIDMVCGVATLDRDLAAVIDG